MLLLLVWLQDAQQYLQWLVALPMLLRRVLVPLRREHVSDKVPLHCMDSLVPTASYPSTYSPLAVGRANSFVVCPPCPPCLCAVAGLLPQLHRGRGIYALRVLPLLCTTTHGSAKDDHSCGRRGRRRRRRWRLERGDAALSASCPPRARANARALESATSPVRPSTSCTGTIASSLAGASGGDERCVLGAVESTVSMLHWGHVCRRHGSPLCALRPEYDGLLPQSTTVSA